MDYPWIEGSIETVADLAAEIAALEPGQVFSVDVAGSHFTVAAYGQGSTVTDLAAECHQDGQHGYQEVSVGAGEQYLTTDQGAEALARWAVSLSTSGVGRFAVRTAEAAALNIVSAHLAGRTPALADLRLVQAAPKSLYGDAAPDEGEPQGRTPNLPRETEPRTTRPGVAPSAAPQPPEPDGEGQPRSQDTPEPPGTASPEQTPETPPAPGDSAGVRDSVLATIRTDNPGLPERVAQRLADEAVAGLEG